MVAIENDIEKKFLLHLEVSFLCVDAENVIRLEKKQL
jgi:hypothetical protein